MLTWHLSMIDGGLWGLWGDTSDAPQGRKRPSKLDCLSRDALITRLHDLGITPAMDPHDPAQVPLWLIHDGRTPVASEAERANPAILSTLDLQQRPVPVLLFDSPRLLDLFTRLPLALPPDVGYGDSIAAARRWHQLALWTLANGLMLPDIDQDLWGSSFANWSPLLASPTLVDTLQTLADSQPGVLWAGIEAMGQGGLDGPSLFGITVDRLARHLLADQGWPRLTTAAASSTGGKWLKALAAADGELQVTAQSRAKLTDAIDTWQSQAEQTEPLSLLLQLSEPDTADGPWTLAYWLQSPSDPSLLVPTAALWESDGDWLQTLRLDKAKMPLLTDLAKAAKVVPAILTSLHEAEPTETTLSTAEASDFLLHAVPALLAMGIPVRVPPWWQTPAKPTMRLQVQSPAATAGMSLDALCAFRWDAALGGETISADDLAALAAAKQPLVHWHGRWVALQPDDIAKAAAWLKARPQQGQAGLVEAMRLQADAEAWADDEPVSCAGWIADVLSGSLSEALTPAPPPATLRAELRPYQQRGLDWLSFCDRLRIGACLADDMGLGKTVQVLALLARQQEAGEAGPTLLVCPMSVVGNWQREAARFVPSLRVYVHHGGSRESGKAFAARLTDTDLVITTYGLAVRDLPLLQAASWRRLVLDEAQHVKNPDSRQAKAVTTIAATTKVAMTGTPVENRLDELWSIMHVLNPGLLGPRHAFQERLATPIERERDAAAAERLKRLISPFVLRRLKSDPTIIADLPEKLEMKVLCNLTTEQASLYQAVLEDMLARLDELEPIARRGLILATMTKLKQICNHPALYLQDGSAIPHRSGKLTQLEDVLTDILAVGDRALIFTQFKGMGTMMQELVQRQFGLTVPFLHGGTSKAGRDAMVAAFQSAEGPPVLIISLKAGGVGLNLTAANHVIHVDRWWNPAVEAQATDRAYRIGQQRNVQVRQFVCLGTLEERIDQMLEAKKALADSIVGTGEAWLTELSTADLREVLALSQDAMMED
jgi:superfamily II DNA or RNA helicase